MGMFKDLRDMKKMADEAQKQNPRPSLREGLSQAKRAMASAAEQQDARGLANDPDARDGTAEIKSIRDTRMTMGEDPIVEFELEVSSSGFTYPVTHTQTVNRLDVGRLQPGAVVDVKIDPEEQDKLLIV